MVRTRSIAATGAMLLLALIFCFPLYWVVSTSFLPREDILSASQQLIVRNPTVENYVLLLTETGFLRSLANSVLVSFTVTVAGTYLAALAGFAFAKYRFRGQSVLFALVLAMVAIPPLVIVVPNFVVMARLQLLDTLWAVILPQIVMPPFGIFWMRQYIGAAVPDALLDSARIDGAGELRIFTQVVLPVIRPALAGLAIWLFLHSWNNLILPLSYLQNDERFTYPVFLASLKGFHAAQPTHLLIAASVLATVPVVAVFLVAHRRFVSGLTAGAVRQ